MSPLALHKEKDSNNATLRSSNKPAWRDREQKSKHSDTIKHTSVKAAPRAKRKKNNMSEAGIPPRAMIIIIIRPPPLLLRSFIAHDEPIVRRRLSKSRPYSTVLMYTKSAS